MNIIQDFLFKRKAKDIIGEPPWDYYFLQNLPEKEYPKYLAKLFYLNTGEKLPLSHAVIDKKKCKTFNQKLQWLKLHGVTDLMRDCTDKVKVRDFVKKKIGEEYLKPVLQIIPNESKETVCCHCEQTNDHLMSAWQSTDIINDTLDCRDTQNEVVSRLRFPKFQFRENWVLAEYNDRESNAVSTYFDQIDFDKLPNAFVLKCNHGSKWQYIIKNKNEFISNKRLFELIKRNITGWLEQEYWVWGGFELQYKGIKPKILIEPLFRKDININADEIFVYCFNGCPMHIVYMCNYKGITALYDKKFNFTENIFANSDFISNIQCSRIIRFAVYLSTKLSTDFNFVRVDWLIYDNKLFFEELTFTPYSGFRKLNKKENDLKLGKLFKL